jgi:hypothetical protein
MIRLEHFLFLDTCYILFSLTVIQKFPRLRKAHLVLCMFRFATNMESRRKYKSLLSHRACCYIYFTQANSCTLFKTHSQSHLKH